eukprot:m.152935 g.152935  ORF g.152935 m.152935 type:complete len:832 (+) comp14275_c0_seq1:199-2694(+)
MAFRPSMVSSTPARQTFPTTLSTPRANTSAMNASTLGMSSSTLNQSRINPMSTASRTRFGTTAVHHKSPFVRRQGPAQPLSMPMRQEQRENWQHNMAQSLQQLAETWQTNNFASEGPLVRQSIDEALKRVGRGTYAQHSRDAKITPVDTLELHWSTWLLLEKVVMLHNNQPTKPEPTAFSRTASEAAKLLHATDTSFDFLLLETMIKWLEAIGMREMHDYIDQTLYEDVQMDAQETGGWARQSLRLLGPTDRGSDPDLEFRRKLDTVATEGDRLGRMLQDDSSLLRGLFALVRSGMVDKAIESCQAAGQSWRAACLQSFVPTSAETIVDEETNTQWQPRSLQQELCRSIVASEGVAEEEKALFAAIAGLADTLVQTPFVTTWHDRLWAFVSEQRNSVHSHIFQESSLPQAFAFSPLTASCVDKAFETTPSSQSSVSASVLQIQAALLQNDIKTAVITIASVCDALSDKVEDQLYDLGLWVQLLLFIRSNLAHHMDEACKNAIDNTILLYCRALAKNDLLALVPTFIKTISDEVVRQAALVVYLQNTPLDTNKASAKDMCKLTAEAVDDYFDILMAQWKEAGASALVEARAKDSIFWALLFTSAERNQVTLQMANTILTTLIQLEKFSDGMELVQQLPFDPFQLFVDEQLQHDNEIAVRHVCLMATLEAKQSFVDWQSHFATKPQAPEKPAGIREQLHFEAHLRRHEERLRLWEYQALENSQIAVEHLEAAIQSAWGLLEEEDASILLGMVSDMSQMHFSMENYSACVQLSNMLAESGVLCHLFQSTPEGKQCLQGVLQVVAQSCQMLLRQGVSPWFPYVRPGNTTGTAQSL